MAMIQKELQGHKGISLWLKITLFFVLFMVFVGGVTRLTDSGLSMVEWRPLMERFPTNEGEWNRVFELYKQYPEYKMINKGMSLSEFKNIFFWEYFHRLIGRLIGLVFFIPFCWFFFTKKLNATWLRRLLTALVLGGSQGLLGWYMVKSGLVDRPHVSHYRLAAHFSLALLIMGYLYYLILKLKQEKINQTMRIKEKVEYRVSRPVKLLLYSFLPCLGIQIVYGAFVAGLKAGVGFNTFPKMGKYWIPNGLFSSGDFFTVVLNSNAGVQFVHRSFGWILFFFALIFTFLGLKRVKQSLLQKDLLCLSAVIFVQFALGVLTLLSTVRLSLASAHQMGACLLVLVTIKTFFDLNQVKTAHEIDTSKL